jgi:hypothetical protein
MSAHAPARMAVDHRLALATGSVPLTSRHSNVSWQRATHGNHRDGSAPYHEGPGPLGHRVRGRPRKPRSITKHVDALKKGAPSTGPK